MDPIVQMLVSKYGMDPATAKNLAGDLAKGQTYQAAGYPAVNRDDMVREVVTDQANTEIEHLKNLKSNAERFTALYKARQAGEEISPEDEAFYQQVLDVRRRQIAEVGKAADQFRQRDLTKLANREAERMGTMTGYANSFVNGATTERLTPDGMYTYPKPQPQFDVAARKQLGMGPPGDSVPPQWGPNQRGWETMMNNDPRKQPIAPPPQVIQRDQVPPAEDELVRLSQLLGK